MAERMMLNGEYTLNGTIYLGDQKQDVEIKKYGRKKKSFQQSANVLFNFMDEIKWLKDMIETKMIIPRYCEENLRYLRISKVKSLAFPMKCFCDINLSKLSSHRVLYGNYGIGLTKKWGLQKNIQPILYINPHSELYRNIQLMARKYLKIVIDNKDYDSNIFKILRYSKPISGMMQRFDKETGKSIRKKCIFHDEKEWRFIPKIEKCDMREISPVLVSWKIRDEPNTIIAKNVKYSLPFKYDDVRYLLVCDNQERMELIDFIIKLENGASLDEKYVLISKILVFDEEAEDW